MLLVPGPTKTACIDKTEVTQEQYSAFLASSPPTTGQPTGCSGNSSFTPGCNYTPVNTPNKPVVCVDWCDAFAYCKAAGKRLCGQIGGGPVTPASGADPSKSQWHFACTQNGARIYPYGSLFDKFACVGLDNNNYIVPQNAGSVASCQGGYSLLYDMSGNVSEWEDSCTGGGSCAARGGHYLSIPADLTCASAATFGRMTQDKSRGFRCCAD
jgi:formylglycine-generating enzyme